MAFDMYISCPDDLVSAIEEFGIVPFFKNSLLGFSISENVDPRVWFSEEEVGVWEWKGPVIRRCRCAYGKLFEKKAAFVRNDVYLDLANWRRDGYDFDARFDDGLASRAEKALFDLVDANAPALSTYLKRLGNYTKSGRGSFDALITRLQALGYVITGDFVYAVDRRGNTYGWGTAEYTTPEKFWGADFTDSVYQRTPAESHQRLLDLLAALLPQQKKAALERFLR